MELLVLYFYRIDLPMRKEYYNFFFFIELRIRQLRSLAGKVCRVGVMVSWDGWYDLKHMYV